MHLIEATDAHYRMLLEARAPEGLKLPPDGVEKPEILQMLRDLANTIRPSFSPASWMMVEGMEIVGLCSIVKLPCAGDIAIGYGVSPSRRRRGFASAAVSVLLEWSRDETRIRSLIAETSIHNQPSQRVLEHNGFERTGLRIDEEDGELICWRSS